MYGKISFMNSTTAMPTAECEKIKCLYMPRKGYVGVAGPVLSFIIPRIKMETPLFSRLIDFSGLDQFVCLQVLPVMHDPGHCVLKIDLYLSNPLWTYISGFPGKHSISGIDESYHMEEGKIVRSEERLPDSMTLDIEKTSVPQSENNKIEFTIDMGKPSDSNEDLSSSPPRRNQNNLNLLLIAAFFAVLTLTVEMHPPSNIIDEVSPSLTRLFILFNSIGFFMSVASITLLLQVYPLKPWPSLSVFLLVGTYVLSTVAIFPVQGLDMLLLASSFSLLATAFIYTYFGLRDRLVLNSLLLRNGTGKFPKLNLP